MGKSYERGAERMKKLISTVAILLAAMLFSMPAFALVMPPELAQPGEVSAENLLAEEYQCRTLIYYTLADDIMDILSTVPSEYGALTMEGKLYLQFSIDGGSWVNFYFTAQDEEGKELQTTGKKLTVTRHNSVSVLNLTREQERSQLPEETYYYDVEYPENSYLLTDEHKFRFRVRVELEWIDTASLKTESITSPWSAPTEVKTTVTEQTLPTELRLPLIASAVPEDAEGGGATINVDARPSRQITLVDGFLRGVGSGVELRAQVSYNDGEWMDAPAVSADAAHAVFTVPASLGFENAAAVRVSNMRIRFRYAVSDRELFSEWTDAAAVGEYIEQSSNPKFEKPSFLVDKFLGIRVWIWMLAGAALLLGVTATFVVRGKRH